MKQWSLNDYDGLRPTYRDVEFIGHTTGTNELFFELTSNKLSNEDIANQLKVFTKYLILEGFIPGGNNYKCMARHKVI